MALLDLTALNAYITSEVDDENKKYSFANGLIDCAKFNTQSQEFMTADVQERIKNSNGRQIDISALVDSEFTVATSLSLTLSANRSTSAKTTVSVLTAFTSFYDDYGIYANNAIAREQDYMSKFRKADKALANAIGGSVYTALNTRKTQVFDTSSVVGGISFDGTNFNADVTLDAQKTMPIYEELIGVFNDNGIDGGLGEFNIVGDQGFTTLDAFRGQFGANNQVELQQTPFTSFRDTSGSITRLADDRGSGFLMRNGAVSLVPSVPIEFANGVTIGGDVSVWDYGDMELPYTKMRPLLFSRKAENDASTIGGSAMSMVQQIGVGVQYAIVTSYNSDLTTKVNDIVRVNLLKA